ncbi:hypothetical protein D3C87_2004990 [compost metagenome]
MADQFRYFGASLPVIAISGAGYYLAVRLIAVPLKKGSYNVETMSISRPTLSPQLESDKIAVSL